MRIVSSVLFAAAMFVVAAATQSNRPAAKAGADSDRLAQKGFAVAGGAAVDRATRLPTRIVHKVSGVRLMLVPAGEFLMGSPADHRLPRRG